MTLDFNVFSAIVCIVISICGASFDLMSSEKHYRFTALPTLARWVIRITAGAFFARAVDLLSLSTKVELTLGQIDVWGMICAICLLASVIVLTAHAYSLRMSLLGWDRLRNVRKAFKEDPTAVAVIMSAEDQLATQRATGMPAVGPRETGEAFLREVARAGRMAQKPKG